MFHNHHAMLSQPFKVVNTLHKMPQPCDNHVTTLQSCGKVASYNLGISIWVMSIMPIEGSSK